MNIKEVFKNNQSEYLKFDRIPENLHRSNRKDICAFLLLDMFCPGDGDIISAAEHDEFFLDVDMEKLSTVATEEDIINLIRCGVLYSNVHDCLYMNA